MAKDKAEVLPIPEKQNPNDYAEMLDQIIVGKKAELQSIIGKITQYKTQVVMLETRLKTMESESRNKILQERTEFEKQRQTKMNDFLNRDELLQRGELDLTRRKMAVEEQEKEIENARVEKNKLIAERLKFEALNNKAQDKYNEAVKINDEALLKLNQAAEKEAKSAKMLQDTQNLKIAQDRDMEQIGIKQQDLNNQEVNLKKLREELTPKIEEYNNLVKENDEKLKAIFTREREIQGKIDENNILFEKISSVAKENKQREIILNTREQEVSRKELLLSQDVR